MGTRSSTRSFTSEIALHLDARGIASHRPRSARQALEHAAYEAHAQVSAPWVSLVAGLPVFFLAGRVLRSRFPYPTASRDGFAVWALYTATDFALVTLSGAIASQGLKGVWGLRRLAPFSDRSRGRACQGIAVRAPSSASRATRNPNLQAQLTGT